MFAANVEKALAKNAEITETEAVMLKSAAHELAEDRKEMIKRLSSLEGTIFGDSASRGYGSLLKTHCNVLKKLQKKHPMAHDQIIAGSKHYKKIYGMFPGWEDVNDLQSPMKNWIELPLEPLHNHYHSY